jgi:DNA-directed RNA polymerase subunit L
MASKSLSSSHFQNIHLDGMKMEFDLLNNHQISTPFANAIRRILLAEIPMITIAKNKMNIIRNTTMLNDSLLMNRLLYIPLNHEWVESSGIPYDQIEIRCNKKNKQELIQSIYVEDFDVFQILPDTLEQRAIKNHQLFLYPKILFAKMKTNQEIQFSAMLSNKTSTEDGAFKSHVCKSVMTFKKDIEAIQRHIEENHLEDSQLHDYLILQSNRTYLKNDEMEPMIYSYSIESIGVYEPVKLMKIGFDYFESKLTELLEWNPDKITVDKSKVLFFAYDFTIHHENDTIGNILSYLLGKKENIIYSGYTIDHPLIPKMVIRLSIREEENIDTYKQLFTTTVQELIQLIQEVRTSWINSPKQNSTIRHIPRPISIPSVKIKKAESADVKAVEAVEAVEALEAVEEIAEKPIEVVIEQEPEEVHEVEPEIAVAVAVAEEPKKKKKIVKKKK